MNRFGRCGAGALMLGAAALGAPAFGQLAPSGQAQDAARQTGAQALETIVVTARRREEDLQNVPMSISVVDIDAMNTTRTYNVSQITQLVPSLNYSSPNPRNTAYTIRGLGSSVVAIAQANDGLEPGVGFYIDQVYYARPAAAAFDLLDTQQVEVLRGPQGTLFGKNSTAGALNITSAAPDFTAASHAEVTGGSDGYWQGKAMLTGPLSDDVAFRLSAAVTRRDGTLHNHFDGKDLNNVATDAARGQLLWRPTENFRVRFAADVNNFKARCCTQVYVRVAPTLKPVAQRYPALAAGLGYTPPSTNPFDREADIDAPLAVDTDMGGAQAIADWSLDFGTVTSITAWRWWNWDAANDRDYTSIPIQLLQHIPSRQDQYSQELRLASNGVQTLDYVAGLYYFSQELTGRPITMYGPQAAYWLLGPPPAVPANLLDHYRSDGKTDFQSASYAAFGEVTWHATDALATTAGLRYTSEDKHGSYASTVSGGLTTTNTTLINRKLSILRPQHYKASVNDGSLSGRGNVSYNFTHSAMGYVSYAQGFKSGGINMSGLPLNPANLPALSTAVVKPERNATYEIGVKSRLFDNRLTLNVDWFDTTVRAFQANVVDTGPGALRGYLANIDKVRVRGVEADSALALSENLTGFVSASWTEGNYVSYKDGPCPIELIGTTTTVCDLSGKPLPALPKFAASLGGEYDRDTTLFGYPGQVYIHGDATTRSKAYGDPSISNYTVIGGCTLVNATVGFRESQGPWEVFFWAKNIFDRNYMQNLTVQAGNSGLIVGTPNEPRTLGLTVRARF